MNSQAHRCYHYWHHLRQGDCDLGLAQFFFWAQYSSVLGEFRNSRKRTVSKKNSFHAGPVLAGRLLGQTLSHLVIFERQRYWLKSESFQFSEILFCSSTVNVRNVHVHELKLAVASSTRQYSCVNSVLCSLLRTSISRCPSSLANDKLSLLVKYRRSLRCRFSVYLKFFFVRSNRQRFAVSKFCILSIIVACVVNLQYRLTMSILSFLYRPVTPVSYRIRHRACFDDELRNQNLYRPWIMLCVCVTK